MQQSCRLAQVLAHLCCYRSRQQSVLQSSPLRAAEHRISYFTPLLRRGCCREERRKKAAAAAAAASTLPGGLGAGLGGLDPTTAALLQRQQILMQQQLLQQQAALQAQAVMQKAVKTNAAGVGTQVRSAIPPARCNCVHVVPWPCAAVCQRCCAAPTYWAPSVEVGTHTPLRCGQLVHAVHVLQAQRLAEKQAKAQRELFVGNLAPGAVNEASLYQVFHSALIAAFPQAAQPGQEPVLKVRCCAQLVKAVFVGACEVLWVFGGVRLAGLHAAISNLLALEVLQELCQSWPHRAIGMDAHARSASDVAPAARCTL